MGWFESANAWLAQQLGAASGASGYALLLVGGALASLLPCVYPLYPITAAVLARRTSRLGRFAHPLSYYLGLAAVYFAFGIVASVTGGSFNDVLRQPAANLGIGALLLLLALATAGLLHFPTWATSGGGAGGLGSTFVMGAGAGLLSSACVGPVVVSILVSIATSTSQVSAGVALVAAAKMMLFGMGVGLPLLIVGVVGVALPKGGAWMVRVQQLFAGAIAWFALGYAFKGLDGLGYAEGPAWALVVGVGLMGAAAFSFDDSERPAEARAKRAVLLVVGVIGFFVVGRGVLGPTGAAAAPAAAGVGVEASATEAHGNLTWHLDEEAAYAEAERTGKPVFVDFHGDWCTNCKAFQALTLSDAALNAALGRAVLLKVRDTTALFDKYRSDPRFPELAVGLPFFVITDARRQLLYKTSDYTKSSEMVLFLPEVNP